LCIIVSVLAACDGGPTAPWPESEFAIKGPVVATDRASYSWAKDSALVWTLTNPNGVDVFYNFGNHIYLERWDGRQWQGIGLYAGLGMEMPSIRLASGETRSARVRLTSMHFPKSGWYRIRGNLYRDTTTSMWWPIGNRVSPAVWVGP
jgi:hypothetical protein